MTIATIQTRSQRSGGGSSNAVVSGTGPGVLTTYGSGLIRGGNVEPAFNPGSPQAKLMACAIWDDSVDGHLPVAVSSSGMGLGVYLPKGAQVVHNFHAVLVVPVGPSNMGLSSEADGDLITSAAISGTPWEVVGMYQGNVVRTDTVVVAFTTSVLTTNVRELQLFGTVAPSSAGRVAFYVEFMPSPAVAQAAS